MQEQVSHNTSVPTASTRMITTPKVQMDNLCIAGALTIPKGSTPSISLTHNASILNTKIRREWIADNYRCFNNQEMASALGCSAANVGYIVRRMGLTRTAEDNYTLLKRKVAKHRATCNRNGSYEQRSDSLKKRYKAELRRLLQGQEQETNMLIRLMPKRTLRARARLIREYNYEPNECDPYELVITPYTTRAPNEMHYFVEYDLRFRIA